MRDTQTSPFPTEKRNVGQRQGWTANFAFTRAVVVMISKASIICRCGGLYVSASSWQDCPTGPPVLNRNDSSAAVTIGTLDMISMSAGPLFDKERTA